jgi:trimethylamine--corrinoid protein Co-methyltransferase
VSASTGRCCPPPPTSSAGCGPAQDTAARAGEICQRKLAEYEPPPLDDAVRAELEDYVARRRAELGD